MFGGGSPRGGVTDWFFFEAENWGCAIQKGIGQRKKKGPRGKEREKGLVKKLSGPTGAGFLLRGNFYRDFQRDPSPQVVVF